MTVPTLDLLSGQKIPIVGLGTLNNVDEKELENALDAALEIGYRHIDTAYYYDNEHMIGKVLKKWFDSGKLKREELFITTKLPGPGIHPDKVEIYLKGSLEMLQLDYVDLYLIHFPIRTTEIKEGGGFSTVQPLPTDHIATWKKLEEQVDLGRTKNIGVSNFNQEQIGRIIANSRIKPASNQVELHVYLQQPELVKYCQDNGIVVVSYSTFCNPGANKWRIEKRLPLRDIRKPLDDAIVKKIAEKHKKSTAQILLKFALQNNIAVIPKSVTPNRLKENFDVFDFTLDQQDIKMLETLDQGEGGRLSKLDFNPLFLSHPEYPYPR